MLVMLDRDGVINHDSDVYIKSPEEWIPIPSALEAIARLTHAGFKIAVITNQSGIARGLYDETILKAIHTKMHGCVEQMGGRIDAIYYCPHHPDAHCACRKPQPALLLQAAHDFKCEITDTPFIGDRASDVLAAKAAGAIPYLLDPLLQKPDPTVNLFSDLNSAVTHMLRRYGH